MQGQQNIKIRQEEVNYSTVSQMLNLYGDINMSQLNHVMYNTHCAQTPWCHSHTGESHTSFPWLPGCDVTPQMAYSGSTKQRILLVHNHI